MSDVLNIVSMAAWNIRHRLGISDILDILLVAVILYELVMLTRKTRGSAVLKGLVLLLLAVGVSNLIGLTALNWLLMSVINNGALVLIILFQPELRKALEQIGRSAVLERGRGDDAASDRERIIREIETCLLDLSRRRVGALIVFEQKTGLQDVVETGTAIDSLISAALLENIFEPNTPLHDGAVIVRDARIVSAGCILPLTDNKELSHELGTRHRAGIGVTETTDALVMIVSEETGVISMASGGSVTRNLDRKAIEYQLQNLYQENRTTLMSQLAHLIHRSKEEAAK